MTEQSNSATSNQLVAPKINIQILNNQQEKEKEMLDNSPFDSKEEDMNYNSKEKEMNYNHSNPSSNTQSRKSKTDILVPQVDGSASYNNKDAKDQKEAIADYRIKINKAGQEQGLAWFEVFKEVYEGRVKLNLWTGDLLLDDRVVTEGDLIDQLEDALGIMMKLSMEQFTRKFSAWIASYSFNPVKEMLEECQRSRLAIWVHPGTDPKTLDTRDCYFTDRYDQRVESLERICRIGGHLVKNQYEPMKDWSNLASILFGTDDKLSQVLLSSWLIASAARAMQPGCKADSALVLKGKQGAGKSTFFSLIGGDYFLEMESSTDNLEVKRQLDRAWIVEMGEIEGITRKKDVEALKAFMSSSKDTFRGLYEKKPTDHPRHVVFGGTCNSDDFLRDSTGSRRFWVIDLGDRDVNLEYLKENREEILATALYYSQRGAIWWLTPDMSVASEERNKNYQEGNEWDEKVLHCVRKLESYVADKNKTMAKKELELSGGVSLAISAFMEKCLNIPVTQQRASSKKIAKALGDLGYIRKKITQADGSRPWVYARESESNQTFFDAELIGQLGAAWF
ncbi:virulence-associated E family protein [Nostoc sp. PA-18-2419]|uniref:virulence-associated E family protein n=1 Tax=Nostoc sp. PA-18-2419 TaxID=2575443 RepID=UPI001108F044|nr:virulence-associated E family protein [Nostoc sp. PA-18-2419]